MPVARLLPLLLVLATTGCAQMRSPVSWFVDKVPEESVKNPVHRIVGVWKETTGANSRGIPTRGFGGEILFFPRKGETPVKVGGDVRIYVFDDQGSLEEQAKPIHQFDFEGGSWNAQLVNGSLGPTYQVFVPYTRRGNHLARCAIRMRYTPEVGMTVYSDMIQVTLRGQERKPEESPFEPMVGDSAVAERSMDVETIRLDRRKPQQSEPAKPTTPGATATLDPSAGEGPEAGEVDVQAVRIERLERMLARLASERGIGVEGAEKPSARIKSPASKIQPVRHEIESEALDPAFEIDKPTVAHVPPAEIRPAVVEFPVIEDPPSSGDSHHVGQLGDLVDHPFHGFQRDRAVVSIPSVGEHPLDLTPHGAVRTGKPTPHVAARSSASRARRYRLTSRTAPQPGPTPAAVPTPPAAEPVVPQPVTPPANEQVTPSATQPEPTPTATPPITRPIAQPATAPTTQPVSQQTPIPATARVAARQPHSQHNGLIRSKPQPGAIVRTSHAEPTPAPTTEGTVRTAAGWGPTSRPTRQPVDVAPETGNPVTQNVVGVATPIPDDARPAASSARSERTETGHRSRGILDGGNPGSVWDAIPE